MTFAIQSGVEIPSKTRTGGESKYPLKQLEIGQSFFVPNAKKALGVTLSKAAKNLKITITTRKAQDYASYDGEGNPVGEKVDGVRVWRVAPPAAA